MALSSWLKRKPDTMYPDNEVGAPVNGICMDIKESKDQVFSSEAMGKGVALTPSNETVVSPIAGTVTVAYPTGHAYGITADNGLEILVHIGIDTVETNGEGFKKYVKQGQRVKRGDKLGWFDSNALSAKGYDLTVMVVITNNLGKNLVYNLGKVTANDTVITLK